MSAPLPEIILQPNAARPEPIPPGTENCGCCEGVESDTPIRIVNRAGLSAIAYRIGAYTQFRASLHAGLSSAQLAPLANLRTRDDDDFTIGLLDAVACVADVLTFYQERIANESYLGTATERVSLEEMGRLIGYRLRPGLAAETWLAFTLETPPIPPPNVTPAPGTFISGVPEGVTLDAGLAVRGVPGPNEKPQVFETMEPVDARPAWNAMRPWLTDVRAPLFGDRVTYLRGVRNGLKAGDAVLFVGAEFTADRTSDDWDFRILESVELQPDADRTAVRWKRPLGSVKPFGSPPGKEPNVFALRKRAAVYGHNSPAWVAMSAQFQGSYVLAFPRFEGDSSTVEWPRFVISPGAASVDLDSVYNEVTPGGYVVLAKGGFNYPAEPAPADTYVELFAITNVSEVSREEFALAGKVTRLSLDGENYALFANKVRGTSAFVQSERLEFTEYPVSTDIAGAQIAVNVGADGLEPGRRLLVRGMRSADGAPLTHMATLVKATPVSSASGPRCILEISPPLPGPLRRESVFVYGNVAVARHGETVAQVLGSGDASKAFQRFELKQLPLTYRAASGELGAASELTVRVDDIAWHERDTMFGARAYQRSFTLQTDEQGRNFVQFGDGVQGARLPSGNNNIRATYRKGLGAAGNVAADSLTQPTTRPLGLKGVSNPLAAAGGTDPEEPDTARRTISLITRTLGRAVSVLDYEDFARAFSGVSKAQAQVLKLRAGPTVVITITGQDGVVLLPDNPIWTNLRAALAEGGDPHVAVRLLSHSHSTFRLGLKVKCDPDYEGPKVLTAVEAALRDRFSFAARELGQPVQQSEVIEVAHGVPGVIAVDLDFLYIPAPTPPIVPSRQTRLLAARMGVQAGEPTPAGILTLDPAPLDRLEEFK